jgi:hypothetical protein
LFRVQKKQNLDPCFDIPGSSCRGIKSSITAIAVMEFFIPEKRPKPKSGPAYCHVAQADPRASIVFFSLQEPNKNVTKEK